ncbi:hypothetical protein HG535_0B06290 [Zygotorulaspora mrakii]|uniref:Rad50/SbcC-type AAA domain-containing protein n=1 Tax=Zygotorulaspora mrakii TaxID=42260 RepID=A0A7H9AZR9_ZYGMR|nr:uncharacterized protein HG535_0B06290 [Zygotorulaspora mrakii]QLG71584.1 hypothetical protein HG535_0B06290 [Zygotorulaspora mrakii]
MILNNNKRPPDFEEELHSLASEYDNAKQVNKKRRYQYAQMTQYPETNESSNEDLNGDISELSPAGYIKKILLKNFMCHEHFELQLGPRLNFIVGSNGSGKSAILTAISICLGAKASDTNRGTALKDLIREGCSTAKITLHLDNENHGSYHQESFGSEIIIERALKKNGTTSFSIKSVCGKEISSKKKDVQAIVDYFSVPLNNPMCFLSQDAARSFLTASTPYDKYSHFMKGTLLQEISTHLDQARTIHNNAQDNLALHLKNLNGLKQEYEDARKLLRELNETTDLNQKKRSLQGKSLWIDVKINTKSCEKLKDEIKLLEIKSKEVATKIEVRREKIESHLNSKRETEAEVETKVLLVAEKDNAHQEARRVLKDIKLKYENEKRNQLEVETNIGRCKSNLETLENTISHLKGELERETGGDKDRLRGDLSLLEAQNEQLEKNLGSLSTTLQDLRIEERRLNEERRSAVNNLQQSLGRRKTNLHRISQGEDNFLTNFDENMPSLLHTIERRSNEFVTPPIGPLGAFVTVKTGFEKWARCVQRAVSSTLSAFVVTNHRDNKLLHELIRSCRIRANIPVITYRLNKFDYSNGKAQCPHPTISDVIEFSKDEAEYVFIDQNRIEKIVLIEDKNDARNFLRKQPRNVNMALALRDQRSGFQISGGYRLDTMDYQERIRLKVGSSDDATKYIQDLIQQEESEIQATQDNFEQRLTHISSKIVSVDQEYRSIKKERQKNNMKIAEIKMNIGKEVDTGILESKINEKKSQEQAIAGYEATMEELSKRMDQISEEVHPLREDYERSKTSLLAAQEELRQLKEDTNTHHRKVEKYNDDIGAYESRIKVYTENIDRLKENVKILEDGIKSQMRDAEDFCSKEQSEDSELPNDQFEIRRQLEKISNMILRAKKTMGLSQQEIVKLFENARDKYREGQERYSAIDKALNMLYKSIQERLQNLQSSRRTTCLDADLDFRSSLRVRNFSGNLNFDNPNKSLNIFILTSNDTKARNVDTLSGGEKSFSQMALLLATWKPMRSRIIALDEFDVFMDQVNRKIGTKLIMEKLKDSARTQTIIITPQDIGKIADVDSSGVSIHKMRDPQRQNNSNYYS